MKFFDQAVAALRKWPRTQFYVLIVSALVIVVTVIAFSVVKFSSASAQSQPSSSSTHSSAAQKNKKSTPTPSESPAVAPAEEVVEGDQYVCEYSFDELGIYVTQQQLAQSTADDLQRQVDEARLNVQSVQTMITELEKGPWTSSHVDPKTNQFVEGTIEKYERAVNIELPYYTNILTTLETQLAQAQAGVPAVPCAG